MSLNNIVKQDLGHGIYVYKNILPISLNIINRLENILQGNKYTWQPAYVGNKELVPDYRNCLDFKYKKKDLFDDGSLEYIELCKIWDDCYKAQKIAVDDYCNRYSLGHLKYWESFNFVKYSKGDHFRYHADHGFSYNCTVSLVGYLNDDFSGGELHFKEQDILYKPVAGDLVIFPSNYMYFHAAMPVKEGIKYSIVTMLDYNDKFHTPQFYQAVMSDFNTNSI